MNMWQYKPGMKGLTTCSIAPFSNISWTCGTIGWWPHLQISNLYGLVVKGGGWSLNVGAYPLPRMFMPVTSRQSGGPERTLKTLVRVEPEETQGADYQGRQSDDEAVLDRTYTLKEVDHAEMEDVEMESTDWSSEGDPSQDDKVIVRKFADKMVTAAKYLEDLQFLEPPTAPSDVAPHMLQQRQPQGIKRLPLMFPLSPAVQVGLDQEAWHICHDS